MKQEFRYSALLLEAERKFAPKSVEVDGKRTLRTNNIKYCNVTVHYFFEKNISKNDRHNVFQNPYTSLKHRNY
jgi:hypothetical protein